MTGHPNGIPPTGHPDYDALVRDSDFYVAWKEKVKADYNVKVIEFMMTRLDDRGEYLPQLGELHINIGCFTYLDLLHETLHLEQFKRALALSINIENLQRGHQRLIYAWFEQGAFEFERGIHNRLISQGKVGFSDEYLKYLDDVLYHPAYGQWHKGVQIAANASTTISNLREILWQGVDWEGLTYV